MINLLPDPTKKDIRAARVNVILTRYIVVTLLAFGFLALLLAGSYVVLAQTKSSAQQVVAADGTQGDTYDATSAQVAQLNARLSEARVTINQEVRYSRALMNIGQHMPAGTVLEKIALNADSFLGTPVQLKAYATNEAQIETLRATIQASPIFTNVSFQSVDSASGGISGYPLSISMTVSLTKAATL